MADEEMPIFTRAFDFLQWLLPGVNHFPRAHRFTFTQRLLDAAFDCSERLQEANYRHGQERLAKLKLADEALDKVRFYLRLAARWKWFTDGQYEHAAGMVAEIGRLLGGWTKTVDSRRPYFLSGTPPSGWRGPPEMLDGATFLAEAKK